MVVLWKKYVKINSYYWRATKLNTKNKKITIRTLLLTSIIGVISVSLYFTSYGTPWEKQTAITESKNYITKYFNLDARSQKYFLRF